VPPRLEFETPPYYGQVALFDPAVADAYPQWSTGDEEAVVGSHGVVVATRSDEEGPVSIELWIGPYTADETLRLIADGALLASKGQLVVGSVVGNDLREVSLDGVQHLSVFVHDTSAGPDKVVFALS